MSITLYKRNPTTGQHADDLSNEERQRIGPVGIASFEHAKSDGGRMYWENVNGDWHRVEYFNIKFVAEMQGVELKVIENAETH